MFCRSFCFLSFGHCIVCPSSDYGFWLPLWYFQAFRHCIVCPSSIYGFWLPLWYLQAFSVLLFTASDFPFGIARRLAIALYVLLRFTAFDYSTPLVSPSVWPLHCMFFLDLRLLIRYLQTFFTCWQLNNNVPLFTNIDNILIEYKLAKFILLPYHI